MTLDAGIAKLAELCQDESAKPEALAVLPAIFPLVPHYDQKTFLPGYAVRRILQSRELHAHEETCRWRLADWASEAMVDFLGTVAEEPGHGTRGALAQTLNRAGLTFRALAVLRRALVALREDQPSVERVFRLVYLAGEEAEAISRWVGMNTAEVLDACVSAEEWVQDEFLTEDAGWELRKLHEAGIRPPGATTRALDQVRMRNLHLWDAIAEPTFYRALDTSVRESSLISELILRTSPDRQPDFIPENSKRLQGYVAWILRNLSVERHRVSGPIVPLEREDAEGREVDTLAKQTYEDWLHDSLVFSRQATVVDAFLRVNAMFQQDHPELVRTFELCFMTWPEMTIQQLSAELKVDRSNVGKRKKAIQEYFERQLKAEGLDLNYYKRFSRSRRLENLYQLIEKNLTEMEAPKRTDRRPFLIEAITGMWNEEPSLFDLLNESYLAPELSRTELAKKYGVATDELQKRQDHVKRRLAERIDEIIRGRIANRRQSASGG